MEFAWSLSMSYIKVYARIIDKFGHYAKVSTY